MCAQWSSSRGGCGMSGKVFRGVAVAATLVFSAATAQNASAQSSKLNIVGTVNLYQLISGPGGNLVIDFVPPQGGGLGTISTVFPTTGNTGAFTSVPPATLGTNIDFVFGPNATPPATTTPVTFLSIGGYQFTALSFGPGNVGGTPVNVTQVGNTVFATLNVSGSVTGPGFTTGAKLFTGAYSTQFPGQTISSVVNQIQNNPCTTPTTPRCGIGNVSVSATFITSAVPEPATVALMGTGLLAMFGAVRRRRSEV